MTRIFVDTRSHRGCWVVARAAGLYNEDAMAFVAEGAQPKKVLAQMRMALKGASSVANMSTVERPCSTVNAVGVVRG